MFKLKLRFVVLVLLINAFTAMSGFAEKISFVKVNVVEGKIEGLKWDEEFSRYHAISSGLGDQYSAHLFGNFQHKGWNLSLKDSPVKVDEKGLFELNLPLPYSENRFELVATGPKGQKESLIFILYGAHAEQSEAGLKRKKWFFSPSIGYASITTKQTGITDYSTDALLLKMSVNYRLKPNVWDIGMSAFGTALQFSKSESIKANYLGANARVGYLFPAWNERIFLSIYGGWYFSSMLVEGNLFGFQNVSGPQVYPSIRYSLAPNRVLNGYFKFSPISNQFSFLNLGNREIAGGVGYSHLLENERSVSVALDLSNLTLNQNGTQVETNSLSLSVQFGF